MWGNKVYTEDKYPWSGCWPEWMPKVGGRAQIHPVILEGYGYCYGDPVRILSLNKGDVVCVVESLKDKDFYKNGEVYKCKIGDLWPIPNEAHGSSALDVELSIINLIVK